VLLTDGQRLSESRAPRAGARFGLLDWLKN
jgi:hypothetical protein